MIKRNIMTNTIYGYARVSTAQQDYATQIEDLKRAGATKIFKDNILALPLIDLNLIN